MGRPGSGQQRGLLPAPLHDGPGPAGLLRRPFPLAEVATTYRFPPTPEVAAQWVERTPPGFTFDVRAWSLLTGAPTLPDSLWPDLQDEVRDRSRDLRRLYPAHLSAEALDECWARFDHALRPLHGRKAGRGHPAVPGLVRPAAGGVGRAGDRSGPACPDYRLAVELRSPKWFEGDACEGTLEWLEERGLSLVCVDGPAGGPRASPGGGGGDRGCGGGPFRRAAGRSKARPGPTPYRYSDDELGEWVPRLSAAGVIGVRRCTSSWTTAGARTPSTTPPSWRRSCG